MPVSRFGNLGRNVVIGPGFNNMDFSIMKNTTTRREDSRCSSGSRSSTSLTMQTLASREMSLALRALAVLQERASQPANPGRRGRSSLAVKLIF